MKKTNQANKWLKKAKELYSKGEVEAALLAIEQAYMIDQSDEIKELRWTLLLVNGKKDELTEATKQLPSTSPVSAFIATRDIVNSTASGKDKVKALESIPFPEDLKHLICLQSYTKSDQIEEALSYSYKVLESRFSLCIANHLIFLLMRKGDMKEVCELIQRCMQEVNTVTEKSDIKELASFYMTLETFKLPTREVSTKIIDLILDALDQVKIDPLAKAYFKKTSFLSLIPISGLWKTWWGNPDTKTLVFVALKLLSLPEQIALLVNIGDLAKAQEILNNVEDSVDADELEKANLLMVIRRNQIQSLSDEQINLVPNLPDELLRVIKTSAFENQNFSVMHQILLSLPELSVHDQWKLFWTKINLGLHDEAASILDTMDVAKLLQTPDMPMPTWDKVIVWGELEFSSLSTSNAPRVFQHKLSYHLVPMDIFIKLVKKFYPDFCSGYIDTCLGEIERDWKTSFAKTILQREYGSVYMDLSKKKELVSMMSMSPFINDNAVLSITRHFIMSVTNSLIEQMNKVVLEVKDKERNRILSNLSHSIKNMLKSVIDPLQNMRAEFPEKSFIIDNAIKGANLIREIVNGINLSYQTTMEDLLWDIANPGRDCISLQDMIVSGLQYSLSNMFDSRYFPAFAENYYPQDIDEYDFKRIKGEWNLVSASKDIQPVKDWTDKYLFDLGVTIDGAEEYYIGNEKSSAIKLMILFQEIIFNAIKYASYVPRSQRFVDISLLQNDDYISFEVKNSFRPEVQAKTTGVGKLLIENFAQVLDCTPQISTEHNIYTIKIKFTNLWRNHA